MPRPIKHRMADAKARLIDARCLPRGFYLTAEDHAEFMAGHPREVKVLYRSKLRREPGFDGVAVRRTYGEMGKRSALISRRGRRFELPE